MYDVSAWRSTSRAVGQRVQEGRSHPAKCFMRGAAMLPVETVVERGYLHRFGGGWVQPRRALGIAESFGAAPAPQAGWDSQEQHGWLLVFPKKEHLAWRGRFVNPRGFSKGGEVDGHAAFQPQQLR